MNQRPDARLLLDEMFSPAVAAELRARGHDGIAVADLPDLRSKCDEEVFAWASAENRWLLTENVKDCPARAGGQFPGKCDRGGVDFAGGYSCSR